jgi:hypothetical protein
MVKFFAYVAGELAASEGKPEDANPWASQPENAEYAAMWTAGWQAYNRD